MNNYKFLTAHGHPHAINNYGHQVREHVFVACEALGHALPPGAEVHHIDNDRANNAPTNLVVCQDRSYHQLLHARQEARDACGHPGWRKCTYCKAYDDPTNMTRSASRHSFHARCRNEYMKQWNAKRKAK